ncbi:Rv3235 family protein [Dactylosporangium sp. AC04546]|uniref:Rv3235 family protein n=1 Tax=Dactylosporangium sp. AC04546 TaxID=2862460 RepID=UPI002E7B771B|nr:Rv3235 family protein [Dactylosporangium sp. AC04546]WVK82950.1 Rv3235 family protein [Dactylosporangium sp. AC04546]
MTTRTARRPAVVVRPVPPLDPPAGAAPAAMPGLDELPLPWPGPPGTVLRRPDDPRPPGAHPACRRFAGLCVEVLNGYRPPAQLRPLTHPHRFTDVTDQLMRRAVRIRMRPAEAARQGRLVRARRLLVTEPLPGVAEAVLVLEQGETAWAMAMRLEHDPAGHSPPQMQGWRCMLLQVV